MLRSFFAIGLLLTLTSSSFAQIPNAGFEEERVQPGIKNWGAFFIFPFPPPCDSIIIDKELYFLNDEPHTGKHALELRNGYCSETQYAGKAVLIDNDTNYASFVSGAPYSGRPKEFAFFYKFVQGGDDLPPGTDTAIAKLVLWNGDNEVEVGSATFHAFYTTQGYTEAVVPIVYENSLPVTSVFIEFSNNTEYSAVTYGTRFMIDDIELRGAVNGVDQDKKKVNTIVCFPNPTSDVLSFRSDDATSKQLTIYSTDGKLMHNSLFTKEQKVDCSLFVKGTYFYVINDDREEALKGQFIVN
jgi:hypothetical protein